jgi:hypothetical protein
MRTEYSVFDWPEFEFAYTVEIYNTEDANLFNSVKTVSEIKNTKYVEVTLRSHLPFEADYYTDNGYAIPKRRVYETKEAI